MTSLENRKLLIITMGDPFSINIEGIASILRANPDRPLCLLIGSRYQWENQSPGALSSLDINLIRDIEEIKSKSQGIFLLDIDHFEKPAPDLSSSERGTIAWNSLSPLENFNWSGKLAVLTCPIEKASAQLGGFDFPGQTEYFSKIWQQEALMILAGPQLRVGIATNHLPVSKVSEALSSNFVLSRIISFANYVRALNMPNPRFAVTGLNPHCSDQGLFGDEEEKIIIPAIKEAQRILKNSVEITGPKPADTVFFEAYQGVYHGVLAMYHDQGLGPLKTVHFYDAINISWGLRHLRVSPDHGPAANLYMSKTANLNSFSSAYELCCRYLQTRTCNQGHFDGTSIYRGRQAQQSQIDQPTH
jgi:4-hydroxythreonine-4-phosphate dehydrogenase